MLLILVPILFIMRLVLFCVLIGTTLLCIMQRVMYDDDGSDVIVWNKALSRFLQRGEAWEAVDCFVDMINSRVACFWSCCISYFRGVLGLLAFLKMSSKSLVQGDCLVTIPGVILKTLGAYPLTIKAVVLGLFMTMRTRLRGKLSCILEGRCISMRR